ncbi:MAG: hypothetical protein ACK5PB_03800 [Pirellula sp.]
MQSVTAALAWEYLARNRWMLLLGLLLSSPIAWVTLLPFRYVDLQSVSQREVIPILMINVLCLVVVIGGCVIATQGSMSSLYLKPLSTTAIVNFFYWGGAFLVACQVALMLWIWKIFFVSDWPIIGSVLFAVVCWGVFQPIFRGSLESLSWVIMAPAAFLILCFWLMAKHGIPVQRGGMLSPQVHYWDSLSGTDGLIAITALGISYVLTLWRVNDDRSGRCRRTLTDRLRDFFAYIDARSASRTRRFESPVQAQHWFNYRNRTIMIPGAVVGILPWFWIMAIIVGAISREPGTGLTLALIGTIAAAIIQLVPAVMIALVHHLGNAATQEIPTGEHTNTENSVPLGISPYLLSLPMSDRDRAHAILRSSAWACGIASAIILVSFAVIVGLSWGLGADLFHGKPEKLGTLIPWFMVVVWGGSLLLSFVFATLVCTLDFQKWSLRDWIAPIILIASLLASLSPISLPLSMALCAITIGYLVYATVRAMLREDISWVGVSLVWLVGVICFTVLFLGLPESFGTHGLLLGSTLLLLAMLPFFTMASAIRQLRTT